MAITRLFPLVILYVIVVCLSNNAYCLPCSYKSPRAKDVLLEVPLVSDPEPSTVRRKRSIEEQKKESQPLRIHLHYDESLRNLTTEKQIYVNSTLLPVAVSFWEMALRVRRPAKDPIKLRRKCLSTYYYYRSEKRSIACDQGCNEVTKCGVANIPKEHLLDCPYCLSTDDCYSSGAAGAGVVDTDFILYVTTVHTKRCDDPNNLAYAAHCQLEQELDRPIAGHVNICPAAISTHQFDAELLTSTLKHEILHALGFSVGLYAFYRDDEGKPRTRRNRYGKPHSLNKETGIYDWDKTTIDTILRTDWWTGMGKIIHPVHMMVTPRVREEARKHFGCAKLEGAELENQGGDGTEFTHFEKRVFENEAMTGTHTQNPVFSRMTLAVMEDSGWYWANYETAEHLTWGHGLGCDFTMKSCGEWIDQRRKEERLPTPYCDEIKHDGKRSLAVTRCTAQRDSLALCNLVPYKKELPPQFTHFDTLPGVNAHGVKFYGGAVELADYCPFSQEFEWRLPNSTTRRDSRCELESNNREGRDILETYGESSRCFDFERPWTERRCGRTRALAQYMAGCYEHKCEDRMLHIATFNSTFYPCAYGGQPVYIRRITDGWLREGIILCPACEELCGDCKEFEGNYKKYSTIGDPVIDEPCSACITSLLFSILLSLVCVIL